MLFVLGTSRPAFAFHLFPLFPGDPGGDCGAKLQKAPKKVSAATVHVDIFFFVDSSSRTSTTTIKAGRSVTWQWDLGHCHSVTATFVPKRAKEFTTYGGKPGGPLGLPPASQVQLVKPSGDRNTFTVKLTVPGTYQYQCVHHASVGMTGTVIVTK